MMERRTFLRSSLLACAGLAANRLTVLAQRGVDPIALRVRYPDLARHFVFEYYPWYGSNPFKHWNQDGRRPPADLAANYVPLLGAYDSASTAVLEQHARWIKDSGAGAINVSWWGQGSDIDRLIPSLMDVMAAHDLRVTFHLEPYRSHRALSYAGDIEYLIRRYGDRRGWDAMLLLTNADGSTGPVFKSFRTILPRTETDCHGRTTEVADFAEDAVWRAQTDLVRETWAGDFSHMTLLADSLDVARTEAAGFDGIAIYDNYVHPDTWRTHAQNCSARRLLFAFNVNPGFDGVVDVSRPADSCYVPLPLDPAAAAVDWSQSVDRDRAAAASERRIIESFDATLTLQTDADLSNARRGFFLVYLNSFNEWHEGHQFEPMKDVVALTPEERARGYHNPTDGSYRLRTLGRLITGVAGSRQ